MLHAEIKRVANDWGLVSYLDRLGLRQPLSSGLAWLDGPDARARRQLISQDYQGCKEPFRRIADGIGPGDPDRTALMISSFSPVIGIKLEAVLALALRLEGYEPVVLEAATSPWIRRYHRLFGHRSFVDFRQVQARRPLVPLPRDFFPWEGGHPTVRDFLRLQYHNVDAGRIALSNVINRRKFETFDLGQPELLDDVTRSLSGVVRNIHVAEGILDKLNPAVALVLEKGLSPAAEIVGACLARGIPVVQYSGAPKQSDFILKRFSYDNRHQNPSSLDAVTWEKLGKLPWSETLELELMRDLTDGYRSGTWFNRKYLHQEKRIKPAEEVRRQLGLDPDKKTVVVFSHVLWDATFFFGENLFDDYETWFLETLRAACANPKVNWVIKLHPDLTWKLKVEGYDGDLRDIGLIQGAVGRLPDHVKLVLPETDINTYSFFDITDYCLTVRGTIGIEMACHGVPVLTAGTGRYSNLGFTIDSTSREEYLERLAHIRDIPPMTHEKTELARRFAYGLFNLRPWTLRSFERVQMPIEQAAHPLASNLLPRVKSAKEFAAAPDMRCFAEWVASNEVDYLEGDGSRGTALK